MKNNALYSWGRLKKGRLKVSGAVDVTFEDGTDFLIGVPIQVNHELAESIQEQMYSDNLKHLGEDIIDLYNKGRVLNLVFCNSTVADRLELIHNDLEVWIGEVRDTVRKKLGDATARLVIGETLGSFKECVKGIIERLEKLKSMSRYRNAQNSVITLKSGLKIQPGDEVFSDQVSPDELQQYKALEALEKVIDSSR